MSDDLHEALQSECADLRESCAQLGAEVAKLIAERDAFKAADEHACEYLRKVLREVEEKNGSISVCSWCALPSPSDEESRRKHQSTCSKSPLVRERDEARGKAAYVMEAFWLAICDLPHSDECDMTTCSHQQPVCDHVNVDCTCPEGCDCECTCWRAAADKVGSHDEAVALCTKLRDAEDRAEDIMIALHECLPEIEKILLVGGIADKALLAIATLKIHAGLK